MADNPPITSTVPETVSVDTGADPESVASLSSAFEDFWTEADSKASLEAPPAPEGDGAAQETRVRESKPEPEQPTRAAEPEAKPEPKGVPVKPLQVDTDDDIERIEMGAHAPAEAIDSFKKMKDLWKADRARMREGAQRLAALETELLQARQNAWTPEAKADYEHAASIRRRFDFASDPEFQAKFAQPIFERYQTVLQEAVGALPDKQAAAEWADHIIKNYSPDMLNRSWWLNSVVNKVPDELERQSLLSSVTELLKLQRDRDSELIRRTGNKSAFDQFVAEKAEFTQKRVSEEIMAEIGTQEQRIKDYLPRNIDEAKTREEREAISAHNERFENLNNYFKTVMHDLSKNGPRAWVRASVEATRSMILEQEYKAMEDELKAARSERDKYKTELDKIHGARRRLSSVPAAPASPAKKDGETSIKGLGDVRKAFDSYWNDIDSK